MVMTNLVEFLRRMSHRARTRGRQLARSVARQTPILLDVAAFVVIVVGTARLFGDWAFLVAGFLLILAGLRASE